MEDMVVERLFCLFVISCLVEQCYQLKYQVITLLNLLLVLQQSAKPFLMWSLHPAMELVKFHKYS